MCIFQIQTSADHKTTAAQCAIINQKNSAVFFIKKITSWHCFFSASISKKQFDILNMWWEGQSVVYFQYKGPVLHYIRQQACYCVVIFLFNISRTKIVINRCTILTGAQKAGASRERFRGRTLLLQYIYIVCIFCFQILTLKNTSIYFQELSSINNFQNSFHRSAATPSRNFAPERPGSSLCCRLCCRLCSFKRFFGRGMIGASTITEARTITF